MALLWLLVLQWGTLTRICPLTHTSNRFLGGPSFTFTILPKLGTSCLRVMQKNYCMHLLLQGWTTVILYCWANQKILWKATRLIQNAATRVLMRSDGRDHVSPVLASLHWLPVRFRIKFKIVLLTFKALNYQAPLCLKDLISVTFSKQCTSLWDCRLTWVSKSRMGGRAFSCQAPLLRHYSCH